MPTDNTKRDYALLVQDETQVVIETGNLANARQAAASLAEGRRKPVEIFEYVGVMKFRIDPERCYVPRDDLPQPKPERNES